MGDFPKNSHGELQHPRRSLGNRYRTQAEKFLRLSQTDATNLSWAEQNARQSLLYDFTNPKNWRVLVKIKTISGDSEGLRAVIEDLVVVLGRNPEHLGQLSEVDVLASSEMIVDGILKSDPLDPDEWWKSINDDKEAIDDFSERLITLDMSDPRANVLFSRRLERLRDNGKEDLYLALSKHILAQRPDNHEAWFELGRMHERREDFDQAWLCYDQAQIHKPESGARDEFSIRMNEWVSGEPGRKWSDPGVSDRVDFLDRMRRMAKTVEESPTMEGREEVSDPYGEIKSLRANGRLGEAFFLARRMAAEGDKVALSMTEEIMEELRDE